MDRSPLRDIIVGLFVLVGLGAMAFLSISVGGFTWHGQGGLKITAHFQETGGLTVHAPVVVGGVRVGEVSGIGLDYDSFDAVVVMDLDPRLHLSSDTFASIITAGLLGDRQVELSPGGDDRILKSGDRITHVESALILEKVAKQIVYGLTKSDSGESKSTTSQPKSP